MGKAVDEFFQFCLFNIKIVYQPLSCNLRVGAVEDDVIVLIPELGAEWASQLGKDFVFVLVLLGVKKI